MSVEVYPANADRFDDVATLLRPRRADAPACWCLYYRLTSSEFSALKGEQRPQRMQDLCKREHSPGMLAYIDGTVVGWCALGPRAEMGRLQRSRTIPAVDNRPVWSIVCFIVRAGHRRKGVARALLNGAIDFARKCGVESLESYPVDTNGARINGSFAYVGTVGMFAAAGFERVMVTSSRRANLPRWIMRLELT